MLLFLKIAKKLHSTFFVFEKGEKKKTQTMTVGCISVHPSKVTHQCTTHLRKGSWKENREISCHYLCHHVGIQLIYFTSITESVHSKNTAALNRALRFVDGSHHLLLVLVDVAEPSLEALTWTNDLCIEWNATLMLVWSVEEASRSLEYILEHSASVSLSNHHYIQPHAASSSLSNNNRIGSSSEYESIVEAFTSIPTVQRVDIVRALNHCTSVAEFILCDLDKLSERLPGFSAKKVEKLKHAFEGPFVSPQQTLLEKKENKNTTTTALQRMLDAELIDLN